MANPSLQIGNGKFAIKENDLLGYSSSGTRFFPIPITMTRSTLGTRVNPSGLIEDVALLGDELVSCGSFDCADPDAVWSRGTGWTISGGKATHTGATGNLSQDVGIGGKAIFLTFDILSIADGVCNVYDVSNATTYASFSTTGTKTLYFQSVSNSIGFRSNSTNVSIDNVSVKEATIDGLARVDYTDGTASLLVEPQRTNLITYSEDFTQSVWVKESGGTGDNPIVTSNIDISPDGTQNADKIVFELNGGTSSSDLSQLRFSLSSFSGDYTNSVYLKSFDGASYNVSILDTNGIVYAATITNEWQRFEYYNGGGTTSINPFRIRLRGNESTSDNAALLIYGAQLEEGSYPTSYIKTQGSSVTRNQDEYTKTGISDKINSEEGVLFVEMAALVKINPSGNITLTDGSGNNRIYIYYFVDNSISVIYNINSTGAFIHNFSLTDITQQTKIAVKWGNSNVSVYINGSSVLSTATSNFLPNTLNQLSFSKPLGSVPLEGKVKQLQVFKTALSDSELATLTT